jgi:hypothetical protein
MLPKLYAEQKMEEAVLSFESTHGPHAYTPVNV